MDGTKRIYFVFMDFDSDEALLIIKKRWLFLGERRGRSEGMAWWAERQSVGDVTNTIGCNEQMKFFGRAPRIFLVLNKTQCFWWTVTVANNASSYWQAAVVISHQTHHPSKRGEEIKFVCFVQSVFWCLVFILPWGCSSEVWLGGSVDLAKGGW